MLTAALWFCSQKAKIACKIRDEYIAVKDFKAPQAAAKPGGLANGDAATGSKAPGAKDKSTTAKLIESMPAPADECAYQPAHANTSMDASLRIHTAWTPLDCGEALLHCLDTALSSCYYLAEISERARSDQQTHGCAQSEAESTGGSRRAGGAPGQQSVGAHSVGREEGVHAQRAAGQAPVQRLATAGVARALADVPGSRRPPGVRASSLGLSRMPEGQALRPCLYLSH